MIRRWKETVGIAVVLALFAGAYMVVRTQHAPRSNPAGIALAELSAPPPNGITEDQAVHIAKAFMQAAGIDMDGELHVSLVPGKRTYGAAWEVSWFRMPQHNQARTVAVDSTTGEIVRVGCLLGQWPSRSPGPPALSREQAIEKATTHARAARLPADARLAEERVLNGGGAAEPQQAGSQAEWHIFFGRYFGDARYRDDGMRLGLDPDTGKLKGLWRRWAMQPPPHVPRNITQAQAIELGKRYLADPAIMGSSTVETQGVNKLNLMVVTPGSEPTPVYAHAGEPSRIAWVIEYSRQGYGVRPHAVEAWIDVEDGSFLGTVRCG